MAERGQSVLGPLHIVHEDLVYVLVRLGTLIDKLLLHSLLKDELELLLLIWGECTCILNEFNQLLITKLYAWGTTIFSLLTLFILLLHLGISLILVLIGMSLV